MSDDGVDPSAVLREYDIGAVRGLTGAGGTAGSTWRVAASRGEYFMRMRGVRTSTEARLEFDHGLRERLVACGVPTVCAMRTRGGARWVRFGGRAYELYPLVVGRAFRAGDEREIAHAARALAEFHKIAAGYSPPSYQQEAVDQFTTLGFSDGVSDRMDDPRLQVVNLLGVRELAPSAQDRRLVERCIERAEAQVRTYAGAAYDRLAGWVIHGDYTPANLLFSDEGEVVGVFDLDWAMPGARCLDVADGLYFFASEPREIDSADIWSLTDAADFALESCIAFLEAYQQVAPLAPYEVEAIPLAFTGQWLSIRLEGMAKVPKEHRFRFFSRGIEKPLLWLDANWPDLRRQLIAG